MKPLPPLTPAQEEAMRLQSRIRSRENIPLDELKAFIILANKNLEKQRREVDKPTDVDFF
jgi:hypothetical protein